MDLQPQDTRADHPNNANDADQENSAPSPTPLGTLSVLPYELRCMIYKPLFQAESTTLTRVSKTFAADTKESLKKHFKFHTTIQPNRVYDQFVSDLGSRPIPADLDQITIHVLLGLTAFVERGEHSLRDLLRQVVDRAKQHKHCHISIELIGVKVIWVFRWAYALVPLRKFRVITVEVVHGVLRDRDTALGIHRRYHVRNTYYEKIAACIQRVLGPQAGCREGKELTMVEHTIQYITSEGWVKALKDREEDEGVDHRFPRLGEEFPGGISYGFNDPCDNVVVPVEDPAEAGAREILRACNGNYNGIGLRIRD